MSRRYNKLVARLEALVQEISDISEITSVIGARETAQQIVEIIKESRGRQGVADESPPNRTTP